MLHSSKLRDKSEGSEYGERHSSILSIQINNHGSFVEARKKKNELYWKLGLALLIIIRLLKLFQNPVDKKARLIAEINMV